MGGKCVCPVGIGSVAGGNVEGRWARARISRIGSLSYVEGYVHRCRARTVPAKSLGFRFCSDINGWNSICIYLQEDHVQILTAGIDFACILKGIMTVTRLGPGKYTISLVHKKAADGMLLLQAAGWTADGKNTVAAFLSYEPRGEVRGVYLVYGLLW